MSARTPYSARPVPVAAACLSLLLLPLAPAATRSSPGNDWRALFCRDHNLLASSGHHFRGWCT